MNLATGRKWSRHRCLWLNVLRDPDNRPGVYVVQVSFWPKWQRSFCR
ncbi:hypothetical protein AB0K00_28930 [Dactylosporangium sp. NPDC049525]